MKRILLVDEPTALQTLYEMLLPMVEEYEIVGCESRTEAELYIVSNPIDLIISETRLPDGDGTVLLRSVRDLHPEAIRMARVGQLNRVEIQRILMIAHRYLPNTCDANLLLTTVRSALGLKDKFQNPHLKELAAKLYTVPSMPGVYQRVMEALDEAEPSLEKIADRISTDPGLTAKLIQMVNSPVFGLRYPVSSTMQAVITLGLEMTKLLVLTTNLFSKLRPNSANRFNYQSIWSQSQQIGNLARNIAKEETTDERIVNHASIAGLLHQMGQLILISNLPEQHEQMRDIMHEEHLNDLDASRKVFGATMPEIGAYLLGLWGLPDTIVEAITWHREPHSCPMKAFTPLTALHIASSMLMEKEAKEKRKPIKSFLDIEYVAKMGMSHRIESWRSICGIGEKKPVSWY